MSAQIASRPVAYAFLASVTTQLSVYISNGSLGRRDRKVIQTHVNDPKYSELAECAEAFDLLCTKQIHLPGCSAFQSTPLAIISPK